MYSKAEQVFEEERKRMEAMIAEKDEEFKELLRQGAT